MSPLNLLLPIDVLSSDTPWERRVAAIENLHTTLKSTNTFTRTDFDTLLHTSIQLLHNSTHFQVVLMAIKSLQVLVSKTQCREWMGKCLSVLVPALMHRLAQEQLFVNQHIYKFVSTLIQHVGHTPVLESHLDYLTHENCSVQVHAVNLLILSILSYPSNQALATSLDFGRIMDMLIQCLNSKSASPSLKFVIVEAIMVLAVRLNDADRILELMTLRLVDLHILNNVHKRLFVSSPYLSSIGHSGMIEHFHSHLNAFPTPNHSGTFFVNNRKSQLNANLPPFNRCFHSSNCTDKNKPNPNLSRDIHSSNCTDKNKPSPNLSRDMNITSAPPIILSSSIQKQTTHFQAADSSNSKASYSAPKLISNAQSPADYQRSKNPISSSHEKLIPSQEHASASIQHTPSNKPALLSSLSAPSISPVNVGNKYPSIRAYVSARSSPLPSIPPNVNPNSKNSNVVQSKIGVQQSLSPPLTIQFYHSVLESLKDQNQSWESQCKALATISTEQIPETPLTTAFYFELLHAVIHLVSNLRSSLSLAAINAMGYMAMWPVPVIGGIVPDADLFLGTLLRKLTSVSGEFISEAVDLALARAVKQFPWTARGVMSTIISATGSKSQYVRCKAAVLLEYYITGASSLKGSTPSVHLLHSKQVTQSLIALLRDANQNTRASARRSICAMACTSNGKEWLDSVRNNEPSNVAWDSIQRALVGNKTTVAPFNVRADGLPDFSDVNMIQNRSAKNNVGSDSKPRAQRVVGSSSNARVNVIPVEVLDKISSKDWKTRVDSIQELEAIINSSPGSLQAIPGFAGCVMDMVSNRLRDGNHQVCTAALHMLSNAIIPAMGAKKLEPYLLLFFPSVVSNTTSNQAAVRYEALKTADILLNLMDKTCLIQALGNILTSNVTSNPLPKLRAWVFEKAEDQIQQSNPPIRLSTVLKAMLQPLVKVLATSRDRGSDAAISGSKLVHTLVLRYGLKAISDAVVSAPGVSTSAEVMNVLQRCLPLSKKKDNAKPTPIRAHQFNLSDLLDRPPLVEPLKQVRSLVSVLNSDSTNP